MVSPFEVKNALASSISLTYDKSAPNIGASGCWIWFFKSLFLQLKNERVTKNRLRNNFR